MGDSLFHEGGPFNLQRTGSAEFSMRIPIPTDENGMVARECTAEECSPGYFKIRGGTGLAGPQTSAYCPYCRRVGAPDEFHSRSQERYAGGVLEREALDAIDRSLRQALGIGPSGTRHFGSGLIKMSMTYKAGPRPVVHPPIEEELVRDLECPFCTLHHAVFGFASWCPDCGEDVFVTHVHREFETIRKILAALDSRRASLGSRVAARDLENALEDVLSVFEASLKYLTWRHLRALGKCEDEIAAVMEQRVRNGYQNLRQASALMTEMFGFDALTALNEQGLEALSRAFTKRHPVTHNLGVVDRKYLKQARSLADAGKELRLAPQEVEIACEHALGVIRQLHGHLFPKSPAS
jgi:hypothetical protein